MVAFLKARDFSIKTIPSRKTANLPSQRHNPCFPRLLPESDCRHTTALVTEAKGLESPDFLGL
jgi:hypothetical protein